MHLIPETNNLNQYIPASNIIDFHHPAIKNFTQKLNPLQNEVETIRFCYEWVRDNIHHSFDGQGQVVTCRASEVLLYREGICHAKAHLLAGILRCLGIPAGFCYQRLVFDDADPSRMVLHGLNGVFLKSLSRWIRIDARGNKEGVNAQFSLHIEQLAFPVRKALGEYDYPTIYANPHPMIIGCLTVSKTLEELRLNLPEDL